MIHLVLDEGRPRLLNTWELTAKHEVLLGFEHIEDAAEALALALDDARARRLLTSLIDGAPSAGEPARQPESPRRLPTRAPGTGSR